MANPLIYPGRSFSFLAALLLWHVPAEAKSPQQIFSQVSNSIVVVNVFNPEGKSLSQGSGVIVGTGKVITNCHVVDRGTSFSVLFGKQAHVARLELSDKERDICRLAVVGLHGVVANIASVGSVEVGARAYAIGAPRGLELSISEGIISSLREIEGGTIIQTTAAISPGSSGGGLFDEIGNLIGITTFTMNDSQNLNFALPANWIVELPLRVSEQAEKELERQLIRSQRLATEIEAARIADERKKIRAENEAVIQERNRLEKLRQFLEQQNRSIEEKQKVEEERRAQADKQLEQDKIIRIEDRGWQADAKRIEEKRLIADEKRGADEERNAKNAKANVAVEKARQVAEQAKRLKDEYIGKIKAKIEQNTSAPEGITAGIRAEFKITLLPTGEVLDTILVRSSGSKAYDEAVERGIFRSVPLPLPQNNPELFREFRVLRLGFTK